MAKKKEEKKKPTPIDPAKLEEIRRAAGRRGDDISWQDMPVSEEQWKMFHGNQAWINSGKDARSDNDDSPQKKIDFNEP